MGRMIVLLFATIAVWSSVAFVITEMVAADNGTILILGVLAFLSTAVIWAVGGNVAVANSTPAPHRETSDREDAKPKRTGTALISVVDSLTPEQIAALEVALERRRDTFDEDEQILVNRLSAEYGQTSQQQV